jgi:hypothetical protein
VTITGLGLDLDGRLLFEAQDEDALTDHLVGALEFNAPALKSLTRTSARRETERGEVEREIRDAGNPRAAGWSFLVNANDPQRGAITEILRPLAEHRGMTDPGRPLVYRGESRDEWFDWLNDEYYSLALEGGRTPRYVLLTGDPQQIPFGFQSVLATVANVGRVDFVLLDHLRAYVEKLLRLENAADPVVERSALFFAPDGGYPDPTYFSRKYMAEPMAERVREKFGLATRAILGDDATKEELASALRTSHPALVYTASHGLGAMKKPSDVQRQLNGAICCQADGPLTPEDLFGAEDVSHDHPFLEGSVVFQFACFGYGTPAESDYAHWLRGVPKRYTDADFVAALPKKLLSHPRGPIVYIGHLDTAFLHGFASAEPPRTHQRWNSRIAPFVRAVEELLAVQPPGLAMQDMNTRYSICNAQITSTYDRQRRGKLAWTPEEKTRFLDRWITRGDAQNYMVLGDPAARLRLPD